VDGDEKTNGRARLGDEDINVPTLLGNEKMNASAQLGYEHAESRCDSARGDECGGMARSEAIKREEHGWA
jgi:hypothetical protein